VGDLSAHFNRSEFACHGSSHGAHATVSSHLIQHLERLRALKGGRPLRIVSGVRCVPHNRAVGGASGSKHLEGIAADIPEGYATTEEAARAGFTGIGSRGRWAIHVDVRRSPARWSY
jgi:uncharacterized protein YcbK (DUF882 family)